MAMKATVNQDVCIGCGTCVSIAAKSFKLNDQGKAEPVEPAGDSEEKIKEAVASCPVSAISLK